MKKVENKKLISVNIAMHKNKPIIEVKYQR